MKTDNEPRSRRGHGAVKPQQENDGATDYTDWQGSLFCSGHSRERVGYPDTLCEGEQCGSVTLSPSHGVAMAWHRHLVRVDAHLLAS